MARFTDLPQELVQQVLRNAQPDDIESVVLVCKGFHAAADSVLEEHRKLKRKYTVITHTAKVPQDQVHLLSPQHHLLELLKSVLADPRIGLYVKKFVVKGLEEEWSTEEPPEDGIDPGGETVKNPRCSDDDIELFKRTADQFPILSPPNISPPCVEAWQEDFDKGNHAAALGILMLYCPNFEDFYFEDRGGHTRRIFDLFEDIAGAKDCNYLCNLKRLRFDHTQMGAGRCHEDINRVKSLLALPSMESIVANDMDRNYHDEVGAPMPYRSSNIQNLSFRACYISNKSLYELLESTCNLKSFTMSEMRIENWWIRAALLESAKHSLEYLSLTCNYSDEAGGYIGPLKPFEVLHTIDIDKDIMENPKYQEVNALQDVLPSSLRSLTMHLNGGRLGDLDECFEELLEINAKDAIMPDLKEIRLNSLHTGEMKAQSRILEKLQTEFAKQDISFAVAEVRDDRDDKYDSSDDRDEDDEEDEGSKGGGTESEDDE